MNFSKSNLTAEQSDFLNHFFMNCPDSFRTNIIFKTFPPKSILINTADSCSFVYILLSGKLQAIEEQVVDMDYEFTQFPAIDIIGDYELFTQDTYRIITVAALEPSLCLVIPSNAYLSWIRTDANALFIRIKILLRQLIKQTQFERQNFFFSNRERFLFFIYKEYTDVQKTSKEITVNLTHNEIAAHLGCSLRTVNRLVKELQAEELITIIHGKIHINQKQIIRIEKIVQSKLRMSL